MSRASDTKDFIDYFARVQGYISAEYSLDIAEHMTSSSNINICQGYLKNCLSLKYTVPRAAWSIVKYLQSKRKFE